MFDYHLLFILSLEIVFYGFICVANGSLRGGYFAILAGAGLLCLCGTSGQTLTVAEFFTFENIAASVLLVFLFIGVPFRLLAREKGHHPTSSNGRAPLLRRG